MMQTAEVDRLMSVAIATARVLGFGIAQGCRQHLESSLQTASLTAMPSLKGEPVTLQPPPESVLYFAEARVAYYTAAMAMDALKDGIPPDGLLHENNFFSVHSWLCPCWPIC